MEKTNKSNPVDAEPAEKGNLRLRARPAGLSAVAETLTGAELAEARSAGENLYLSHFATCPDRERHRRR